MRTLILFIALTQIATGQSARILRSTASTSTVTPQTIQKMRLQEELEQKRIKAALARYPDEWRRVNGTNYNLAILFRWQVGGMPQFKTRPLPAWQQVSGDVIRVANDGILLQTWKTRMITEPGKVDRLTRTGKYTSPGGAGLAPLPKIVSQEKIEGDAVLLKNYPGKPPVGSRLEAWVMLAPDDGETRTYDYGIVLK